MTEKTNRPGRKVQTEVSEKQREVYDAILRWVCRNGYQPTVRDLATELGIDSKPVQQRLQLLERKGLIASQGRVRGLGLPGVRFERVEAGEERKPTTEAAKEVWELVVRTVEERGSQPSDQEMADALGVSTTAVQQRVETLERANWVKRTGERQALWLAGVTFRLVRAEGAPCPS